MNFRLALHFLTCAIVCLGIATNARAQSSYAERIALTGKVWGFIKYHHTGTCDVDWDQVLITALDTQSESDDEQTFNAIISDLIVAAGENHPPAMELPVIDEKHRIPSDTGWMQDMLLSDQNRVAIQAIVSAFRPFQTCHITEGQVGEPSFAPDDQFRHLTVLDPAQRMLALFRYWNIVNYFSPYKSLIDDDWEAVLEFFVDRMLNVSDDLGNHLLIREFTAEVGGTKVGVRRCGAAVGIRIQVAHPDDGEGRAAQSSPQLLRL